MTAARPAPTEREFQEAVIQCARLLGWQVYHTWFAGHSAAGFPDLVLVKPPRVVFAELKGARGHLTPAQAAWGEALAACPGIVYHLWRPSDWPAIERMLAGQEVAGAPIRDP